MSDDRFYVHWINTLPETRDYLKIKLLQHDMPRSLFESDSDKAVFEILRDGGVSASCEREGHVLLNGIRSTFHKKEAEKSWSKLIIDKDLRLTAYGDVGYPERLKNMFDPPVLLYHYGNLPDENRFTAGIVGSRNASEDGRRHARQFGEALSKAGIGIISGMALGIDSEAMKEALKYGRVYAVLGCGPDVIYPPENSELYRNLKEKGSIISEYPPGTKPFSKNFPKRNRIISAFSDKLAVIEAGERSGSLITARLSLEYGKDVFCIPGRPEDIMSRGCNSLIKKGMAGLVTEPYDVICSFFYN